MRAVGVSSLRIITGVLNGGDTQKYRLHQTHNKQMSLSLPVPVRFSVNQISSLSASSSLFTFSLSHFQLKISGGAGGQERSNPGSGLRHRPLHQWQARKTGDAGSSVRSPTLHQRSRRRCFFPDPTASPGSCYGKSTGSRVKLWAWCLAPVAFSPCLATKEPLRLKPPTRERAVTAHSALHAL